MELLLFGPIFCAGVYLLTSPAAIVPLLNSMMKTAHELDHSHGVSMRPIWELRVIPNTPGLHMSIRAAGVLLMLFAAGHLTGMV